MRPARRRGERGSALVEFSWLAILLLVPLVWIMLTVFEVQRGAFATSAAARSAGRAYALAPDDSTGDQRARSAAELVMADQGADGQEAAVTVSCRPASLPHCHAGTATITVRVESSVALPYVPSFLGSKLASIRLESSHSVPIGQYVASSEGAGGADR
jgi:Flp pilus assembly protein TadG